MDKEIPKDGWCNRTKEQENVCVNEKNGFRYLMRGVERTPIGTEVSINQCNSGVSTTHGVLKGTANYSLVNKDGYFTGQCIAFSRDLDDLYLFAIEHGWSINDDKFKGYKQLLGAE